MIRIFIYYSKSTYTKTMLLAHAHAHAQALYIWRVYRVKMKVFTPEVVWHEKQPILSVDFHHSGRLASGGADNFVRVSNKFIKEFFKLIASSRSGESEIAMRVKLYRPLSPNYRDIQAVSML